MKEEDFVEEFIEKCRKTDFSSESRNKQANLEQLKAKLPIMNEERDIYMKKGIRKPIAIAACIAVVLSMSVVVFGQDVVNYIRTVRLGDHANYIVSVGDVSDEDMQAFIDEKAEGCEISDEEYELWTEADMVDFNWLTFTDAAEAKSHFITNDALLPTYLPEGFEFDHIYFFVESLEDLQEYGANKFMTAVFSNGTDEIQMQIRFMDETTRFVTGLPEDIQVIDINGNEAIVAENTLDILIGDTMYFIMGSGLSADELIAMAASLR